MGREKHIACARGSPPGSPSGGHRAGAAAAGGQGCVREVLVLLRALGAGCGAAGVPWPGWGCLSPRWCPQLPRPPMCALRGAAADRSSVSLVTAGSRYSGKEAGSARKGLQVWGDTALAGLGLPQPLPPCLNCLGSPSRGSARSPDRRNAGRPRPGLEPARKGCSAVPGGIQPAPRGERSSDLRRCELPPLPRG